MINEKYNSLPGFQTPHFPKSAATPPHVSFRISSSLHSRTNPWYMSEKHNKSYKNSHWLGLNKCCPLFLALQCPNDLVVFKKLYPTIFGSCCVFFTFQEMGSWYGVLLWFCSVEVLTLCWSELNLLPRTEVIQWLSSWHLLLAITRLTAFPVWVSAFITSCVKFHCLIHLGLNSKMSILLNGIYTPSVPFPLWIDVQSFTLSYGPGLILYAK